jgi:hypothetical protein
MSKHSELVQSFLAAGQDGRSIKINVYQDISTNRDSSGSHTTRGRMLQLETSQGQTVKFVGKGQYKIVASGEILTCDDPGAPK